MECGVILGTAGHIDHGKTALVRALTGVDTDRLPEEKRRGITIDLGFAPLVLEGVGTVGVVDVPGHESFIRTMLAGASGIDMALLVIAADEGIMPQTREHLEILSLLDIPRGVIALTKCDLVEDDWLTLVRADVYELTRKTFLRHASVVPVSAVTGRGLESLRSAISAVALESRRHRDSLDLFRMPVDRAFTVNGTGTVVTGTIWSGEIRVDDSLIVEPGRKKVRVRAIQSHGSDASIARPGQRAALALAACNLDEVARGSTVIGMESWTSTRELEAFLDFLDHDFEPTPRMRFSFHLGTADTAARLIGLRVVKGGPARVIGRVLLDEPLVARGGDRFILRLPTPARTIGGGEVIDPFPLPRRRGARLNADVPSSATLGNPAARIARMVALSSQSGVSEELLPIRAGIPAAEVEKIVRALELVRIGGRVYSPKTLFALETEIEGIISSTVRNYPLTDGVSLQTIRVAIAAAPAVMNLALDRLKNAGRIELDGSVVKPSGWGAGLESSDQAASDAIMHEICINPAEPPSVAELSRKFGVDAVGLLKRLERKGSVERISDDRYYAAEAVASMIGKMKTELEPGRVYSPAELKEVLGVSRKYLIPFLEFCDRKGITSRSEQGRKVRREGKA